MFSKGNILTSIKKSGYDPLLLISENKTLFDIVYTMVDKDINRSIDIYLEIRKKLPETYKIVHSFQTY